MQGKAKLTKFHMQENLTIIRSESISRTSFNSSLKPNWIDQKGQTVRQINIQCLVFSVQTAEFKKLDRRSTYVRSRNQAIAAPRYFFRFGCRTYKIWESSKLAVWREAKAEIATGDIPLRTALLSALSSLMVTHLATKCQTYLPQTKNASNWLANVGMSSIGLVWQNETLPFLGLSARRLGLSNFRFN